MEEPVNTQREIMEEDIKADRSLLYMGIGLGAVILVMGYLTLFVDNVPGLFSKDEEVVAVIEDNNSSDALDENAAMSDSEVRSSLIKFIEAFYRDQARGYFDPPSYFSSITQTYYNYHNLTHKRLRDLHYKRLADLKNYKINWLVSTLDFDRSGAALVATYWANVDYIRSAANRQESADIKFEMVIDELGKIQSLREVEVKNLVVSEFENLADSMGEETWYESSVGASESASMPVTSFPPPAELNPAALYEGKLYDLGSVETGPEYKGGQKALGMYLGSMLRYPARARENKVQGKVYVSFVVEKDGSLTELRILKGIGSGCDEEALRVLRLCPPWKPGTVAGKPVRTSYVLPITYQLVN